MSIDRLKSLQTQIQETQALLKINDLKQKNGTTQRRDECARFLE
jgi:hypothetical protein